VETLLAHGANPNTTTLDVGLTPLHAVAERGHVEIAEMLINKGADLDKGMLNAASGIAHYRCTPLQLAAHHGCKAVVHVLLAAGAKIWEKKDKKQKRKESRWLPDVAGGLSRAAVVEMKRSINAPS
jgi:ankyrin repeat protein